MNTALEKLVARYPFLRNTDFKGDDDEPTDNGSKHGASGRRMNAKKSNVSDNADLAERFPALRTRRKVI